jgi:hypothetical protein
LPENLPVKQKIASRENENREKIRHSASLPPCPAQPQPASAMQSAHKVFPAIASAPKFPQRSHAASSLVEMVGWDSTSAAVIMLPLYFWWGVRPPEPLQTQIE